MSKIKILIVEDEPEVAEVTKTILENFGYAVLSIVSTGEEAIEIVSRMRPDLVLMDIVLEGNMDGINAAKQVHDRFNVPVVYLTAYADEDKLSRAKVTEPYGYILKPFKAEELHVTIEMILYKHEVENKIKREVATTLRSIGDAVITVDKNGLITFMNPVAESLTGWKQEIALNRDLTEVFNIKDKEVPGFEVGASVKSIIDQDTVSLSSDSILIPGGNLRSSKEKTEIHIEFKATPIRDDEGIITGFVLVFRDIAERKKAEEDLHESEERYRSLIESSEDPIYLIDRNLKYKFANKKFLSRLGKSPDEVIGQNYLEFHNPELTKEFSTKVEQVSESSKPVIYEYKSHRDGRDFLRTLSPIIDPETGSVIAITVISKDISERKRTEEQIKHLNLILRAIRSVNQLITREKHQGHLIQSVCDNLTETCGYHKAWTILLDENRRLVMSAEAGLGKDFLPIVEQLKRGDMTACGKRTLKKSEVVITKEPSLTCVDYPLADKYNGDGAMSIRLKYREKVYGLLSVFIPANLIEDEEEQILFKEVAEDISFALHNIELEEKQKFTEDELRIKESAIASSINAIVFTDLVGNLIYVNNSFLKMWGYDSQEEVLDKPAEQFWQNKEEFTRVKRILQEKGNWTGEILAKRKDGSVFDVQLSASMVKDETGKSIRIMGAFVDISELKQAQRENIETLKYLEHLFVNLPVGILSTDNRGKIIMSNPAGREFLPDETAEGVNLFDLPLWKELDLAMRLRRVLETGELFEENDFRYLDKDGKRRIFFLKASPLEDIDGKIIGILVLMREITNLKKLEEKLFQTEKIASLGQLASELAHKMRNPLAVIRSTIQFCIENFPVHSELEKALEVVQRNADTADGMIFELLNFARPKELKLEQHLIHDTIDKAYRLVEPDFLQKKIEVQKQFCEGKIVSLYDEELIIEVLVNIFLNSIQAMQKGGKILIGTNYNSFEKNVTIDIKDSGYGISDENIKKVFDPFFSTKKNGTGLGLSICHKIMDQHNGSISIDSKVNKGTKVTLTLPVV